MTKKWIGFLFGVLLLGFPFESHCFHIFRPLSRSFLHKFEMSAPFSFTVPKYFEKHMHFYLSDILIILILILISIALRPQFKMLVFNKSSRFLTLLWGVALLSLVFSIFSSYYYQYFNLLNLAITFFIFHTARFFFQNQEKTIDKLLKGLAFVSFFQCCVGIWQFFTQSPLGIFILGEAPLHLDGPHLVTIPLTNHTRKLIEYFHLLPEGRNFLLRAYGTFLHPNIYGEYMAISLMVSYFLYIEAKIRLKQYLILILILVQVFSLCLSFSRAAILSWGIGSILWLAILLQKNIKVKKKKIIPVAVIALSSLCISFIVLLPHFTARGGFFNRPSFVQNADSIRMSYHYIAWSMIKSYPFLGIGYNCFIIAPTKFFLTDPNMMRTWTHNIYLLIGSETGILGLGCFLLFIFSILRICFRYSFTSLTATLFAIFIGFLIVGLFDFYLLVVQTGKLMFFLFSGILAAQLATKAKTLPSSSQL